jgi:hypothetical protein
LVTFVTRQGIELAKALRATGHRLAEVNGHARDGDLTILFVETPRRLPKSWSAKPAPWIRIVSAW